MQKPRHDLTILKDALRTYKPEASDRVAVDRMLFALVECYNSKRGRACDDLFTVDMTETFNYNCLDQWESFCKLWSYFK